MITSVFQAGTAPRRGTLELMRAYRDMPWLRAVLDRIASSIASSEWMLFRKRGDERVQITSHPLIDLLNQFNPSMTGRSAWHLLETWVDLKGEAFLIAERNGAGVPVELWPVPPHWVKETPSRDKPFFQISQGSFRKDVPAEEMIWLRIHDPENPYARGVGLAEALADELDTDEYASKHTKAWFYNRAVPDILVGVKGANEPQLKRAKQLWENSNRGAQRSHKSHWHSGDLTVEQLSQTFSDMQLVALREFERNAIIQTFGVPPEILGIVENSNRSTIDAASYIFSQWVLTPRLDFLKSELNFRLAPLFGSDLELDFVSPVPVDKEHTLSVLKAAPHVFTADEVRGMAEHDEMGEKNGGDVHATDVATLFVESLEPGAGDTSARLRRGARNGEPLDDEGDDESRARAPARAKAITPQEVDLVADALRPIILTSFVDPEIENTVLTFGQAAIAEVGAAASFSMLSPIVVEHLVVQSSLLVGGVNETTRETIRRALLDGTLAGEGSDALGRRIERVFDDADRVRAKAIARTEVNTSANFARWQGMAQSGVVTERRWLTARDSRVRDAHRFLNNKRASISAPFNVGGFTAMFPGGFKVPRLDINCRCTTIPVIDITDEVSEPAGDARAFDPMTKAAFDADASIDDLDAYAEGVFRMMAEAEERIANTLRSAFAQQRGETLDALARHAG
jgi:HK97 family phage portal protein